MDNLIENTIDYIVDFFQNEASGHDAFHTMRVYRLACTIAEKEVCDKTIVMLAALLHDVDDRKIVGEQDVPYQNATSFLKSQNVDEETIAKVCHIISQVSFKGKDTVTPDSIEGMIIQDADRLDAIGAIGIARTFAYGGNKHHVMYDPAIHPMYHMDENTYYNYQGTTINHFYEKLFLLKDMMNTDTAKKIAQKRHEYMEEFMEEFLKEWDGIL